MIGIEILNNAVNKLSTEFDVVGELIDLSVLQSSNGKKKITDLLVAMHRPEFKPNQRILVYQPSDFYSYTKNLASDSLIFLQTTLQKIDISNYFVIVISGNPLIKDELEWVQCEYSTDSNPMSYHYINLEFNKIIPATDTFCVNMWNHLHISTQLEILPCGLARNGQPLGRVDKNTPDSIVNNSRANNMRLMMLAGQRCSECETCYNHEDRGLISRRIHDNTKFKDRIDYLKSITNPDGSLTTYKPATVDIRLNNICNLKCRTCNGVYSSQLAQEEKKIFNNIVNFQKIPSNQTRAQVLDSVINYFDHAESIYFAGGEPLILKEHYDILDHLIKINKTNLKIVYHTNFSNLIFKNKRVFDHWEKFSNVCVNASLDGHGHVFEYVRHGAKWIDIEKNLLDMKTACPHVDFEVTSTISLLSIESVIELQQMWHNSNKLDITKFKINLMHGNDFLSLQSLLPHHKKTISKKIDDHCHWLNHNNAVDLINSWKLIQQNMWADDKSYINKEFAKINQLRDIERHENFELTYPQFYDLFAPYYNEGFTNEKDRC